MKKWIIIAGIVIGIVGETIHFRILTVVGLIMIFFNRFFLPESELRKEQDNKSQQSKKRIVFDDDDD